MSKTPEKMYQNFIKSDPHLWWVRPVESHRVQGHQSHILERNQEERTLIPVPDMERFNPKPAFGGRTAYIWGLVHGTTVSAAAAILAEGFIRPADWQ